MIYSVRISCIAIGLILKFKYSLTEKMRSQYKDLGGELHLVELKRNSASYSAEKLGMELLGDEQALFVASINPHSVVLRDGRIKLGDQVLEVNGHVLYGQSAAQANRALASITASLVKVVLIRYARRHSAVCVSYICV